MLCARAKRRRHAVGMAGVKKWEAVLWIGRRVVAKTDFSHQMEQTSRWRVVGQSWATGQPKNLHNQRMDQITIVSQTHL
jgi:hypothetical protein